MKRILILPLFLFLVLQVGFAQTPTLTANSATIPQGGSGLVTYTLQGFHYVNTFNGTITWDPAILTFDSIINVAPFLPSYPASYNVSMVASGNLGFSWFNPISLGNSVPDGTTFIQVKFHGIGASGSTCALGFSSTPVPIYFQDGLMGLGPYTTVDGLATVGTAQTPVAAFTAGGTGLYHVFSNTSTGSPTAYNWTFGDGTQSALQNPTHSYAAYGTYQVCLTATNINGSDSSCQMVYATMTVGVGELLSGRQARIFVSSENHVIEALFNEFGKGSVLAEVYNLQGQKVIAQQVSACSEMKVGVSQLTSGIYLVRLIIGERVVTQKVIISQRPQQ
ncbi:MAG: PKD domain-containing protein [Bacteroidota bacterium]